MTLVGKIADQTPTVLKLHDCGGFLVFDAKECRDVGASLHDQYANAHPFPHIALDNLISPEILRAICKEFPSKSSVSFNRAQERLKLQFGPGDWCGYVSQNIFSALNSQAFLSFLETLTGIKGLIVDPNFEGGGFHETKAGGHLSIHADFNILRRCNLVRRLNLLVYLNDDWPAEYGGNLELWDKGMKRCEVSVPPVLGKAVIFSTNLDSFHGQPDPVTCPTDRARRSIATYYYTAPEEGIATIAPRTTTFQTRPHTTDEKDWKVRNQHFLEDWVPAKLQRATRKYFWRLF